MSKFTRPTKQERKAIKNLRSNRKGGKRVIWDNVEYDDHSCLSYNIHEAVRSDLSAYN